MARFEFTPTPIRGVVVVQRQRREDARGFLSRLYCVDELAAAGMDASIAQINQTLTRRAGTIRGMHYQEPPHAETKLVSCLHGEVFDVAVDLRRRSPTFLMWHAEILSPENERALLIPRGMAHGFQTLTDECELLYLHTATYAPEAERALNALDPRLAIHWPRGVTEMSERDGSHPMVSAAFEGLAL
jgi:dTDP-4-dehydrorhamnose 3,5-epimerase